MVYRQLRYHELAIDHFKSQLALAWELNDQAYELKSYENLSVEFYYAGNIPKAKLYHDRTQRSGIEAPNSSAKLASNMLNNFNRNFKEKKYNFN